MSTRTSIWDTLTQKYNINFDLPQHDTDNLHRNDILLDTLESSFSTEYKNNTSISNELLPLLSVSCANKMDISQLLLTQYQLSNLSLTEFISRSSLLNEIRSHSSAGSTKHGVLSMLSNYLRSYNKYISNPLPVSSDDFPYEFRPYSDKIDILLQYMMRINRINEHNLVQARPAQFDVYFVPPNTSHNFASFYFPRMAYSAPRARVNYRSGLDDLYSLFCSETGKTLINGLHTGKKRLILLIVRGNEYDTDGDVLYLYTKDIMSCGDLRSAEYENNEILWNLNSKQDYPYYLNISYHLHNKCNRIYLSYNGFGQRISKNVILDKLPLMFTEINGKNKISKQILHEFNAEKQGFNDFISSDKSFEFGQSLFGLQYKRRRFRNAKRRLLNIPRSVIANGVVQIQEFDDPPNQLYYYLTWTCKMQVIDGEFSEYTLSDNKEIAIFNSELHEKQSNNVLYAVATLNRSKPKWSMHRLMSSQQIYETYHINPTDLPLGSRYIHNYFQSEMTQNHLNLHTNIAPINDWNKVPTVFSQTFRGDPHPNLNNYDLNRLIMQSIATIRYNNNLSLIPILRIDTKKNTINCHTLIPIVLADKHIAISYNMVNHKIVIRALYIDAADIIKKAALVDANAVNAYKYLFTESPPPTPDIVPLCRPELKQNWSYSSHDSGSSVAVTDQTWVIQSLQEQLNNALQRENLLVNMLKVNANNNTAHSLPMALLSVNGVGQQNNFSNVNTYVMHVNPIPFPSFTSSQGISINSQLMNQFPLL